jgi:hypothetical protein
MPQVLILHDRPVRVGVLAALLFLGLAVWLSSGSLSPYAISHRTISRSNYVGMIDDWHFQAPYYMLRGKSREKWETSVVLRRTLYPLLAFPFMRMMGFAVGGFVASLLLQIGSVLAFVEFLYRRIGRHAAVCAAWLLATYPGITYWAGLPYCYAIIVPCCLIGMILLWEIDQTESGRRCAILCLGLGVLFLGYDLLPYFAPAAMGILLWRRKGRLAAIALPMLIAPTAINLALLKWIYAVPVQNSNTATYLNIVRAYLHPARLNRWMNYLRQFPRLPVVQFFDSNFLFLPLLFLGAILLNIVMKPRLRVSRPEKVLVAAIAAVFLFINLAPPFRGFQVRGGSYARLYQPIFVVMVLFVCRLAQHLREQERSSSWRFLLALTIAVAVCNATVALGPLLKNPVATFLFQRFYPGYRSDMLQNLEFYGRRPLGLYHGVPERRWRGTTTPAPPVAASRPASRPAGQRPKR